MQRKNNILRTSHKNKKAFAMIMAISVIVIISTIMALSLSMTTQTTKRTTDLYVYEQAVLLSKSAAEYALLEISQHSACSWKGASFTQDGIYKINITPRYIYTEASVCANGGATPYSTAVTTPEQNGSVLLDITVSVEDENVTSEPIRFFRRSMQKL